MSAADLLKGKPLKMPLHSAIVHFPIALFTLSVLLDIGGHVVGGDALVRGAFYALTLGLITSVLAAVPGLVDYAGIRADHPGRKTAIWHLVLNVAAVIVFAISLAMRWGRLDVSPTPPAPVALSVLGFLIIAVSGYLGGKLVYGDGIGVGRHRRARLPERTLSVTADSSGGFTPVAVEGDLTEGNTLRVDVGGTIMTLVRLQGEVYAIQEFCTHRHGPLSEGCFADGQVQCPWHNSRFDVRSGKVMQGPAKVDLNVFATRVSDNRIWVQSPPAKTGGAIPPGRKEQQAALEPKQPHGAAPETADPKLHPDQPSPSQPIKDKRPS
jgi:nitrite reductase/ring-hydroxylating ferredoxin subunit/uncharacterized membrane protein